MLYLGCDFLLWRLIALVPFGRFLFIALGGIMPLLSFFFEFQVPPLRREADRRDRGDGPRGSEVSA